MGLPVKLAGDAFHVTGCFCSLECAAAYNFDGRGSVDETLNRFTLINALAERMGLGLNRAVRPAPSRLALTMFGGHMGIEEFRAFSGSGRQVIVHSPPMLTLTQQVEEVNDTEMRSEYRFVPLDSERVSRYQERVRMRRTKPLVSYKNTLDHAMNLTFC